MIYLKGMRKGKNIAGGRVAIARKTAKLTQAELSKRLKSARIDICRAGVAKIEMGLRCVYDYELPVLANELGVSVKWLLNVRK